jgi:hypothetical protein
MGDHQELRGLLGADGASWTAAQLEQLSRDIDAVAALLLDIYKSREKHHRRSCGLPSLDDREGDR